MFVNQKINPLCNIHYYNQNKVSLIEWINRLSVGQVKTLSDVIAGPAQSEETLGVPWQQSARAEPTVAGNWSNLPFLPVAPRFSPLNLRQTCGQTAGHTPGLREHLPLDTVTLWPSHLTSRTTSVTFYRLTAASLCYSYIAQLSLWTTNRQLDLKTVSWSYCRSVWNTNGQFEIHTVSWI